MWTEARASLRTVRDVVRFAVSRFAEASLVFGHGTDNAFDEAAYLILHTLKLPLDRLEPFMDARLTAPELDGVLTLLQRRVDERIPAAYLTHEAWLGEFRFYVDERVIVPRSHIAELLQEGLTAWVRDTDTVSQALDLCTGSGCLAILLAHAFPTASVDAVDVSEAALEVARRNVDDYGLQNRVRTQRSDLFAAIDAQCYEIIVSNPPYVNEEFMQALPAEFDKEPKVALDGGTDGLLVVRRIIAAAKSHLTRSGVLVCEVGGERAAVEAAYPEIEFTWLDTSAGGDQVFLLERGQLPD
ncbi:MAG: 50S ribosomal protein L3 N(5)-glutamine methyltransferase [Betaproteobacteria bacterium]